MAEETRRASCAVLKCALVVVGTFLLVFLIVKLGFNSNENTVEETPLKNSLMSVLLNRTSNTAAIEQNYTKSTDYSASTDSEFGDSDSDQSDDFLGITNVGEDEEVSNTENTYPVPENQTLSDKWLQFSFWIYKIKVLQEAFTQNSTKIDNSSDESYGNRVNRLNSTEWLERSLKVFVLLKLSEKYEDSIQEAMEGNFLADKIEEKEGDFDNWLNSEINNEDEKQLVQVDDDQNQHPGSEGKRTEEDDFDKWLNSEVNNEDEKLLVHADEDQNQHPGSVDEKVEETDGLTNEETINRNADDGIGQTIDDDESEIDKFHFISSKETMVDQGTAELWCRLKGLSLWNIDFEESVGFPTNVDLFFPEKRSEIFWMGYTKPGPRGYCVAADMDAMHSNEKTVLLYVDCNTKLRFMCKDKDIL